MTEADLTSGFEKRARFLAGRETCFDAEGFFLNTNDWGEEVVEILAREEGLKALDGNHWRVTRFIRNHYLREGRAPMNRELRAGPELSLMELESVFPGVIRNGARILAGLPIPMGCA